MKKSIILVLTIIVLLTSCTPSALDKEAAVQSEPTQAPTKEVSPPPTKQAEKRYLVPVTLESEAIANNKIDQPPERTFFVYLPPSYHDTDKSYPVVYFLAGFGGSAGFTSPLSTFDDELKKEDVNEFIIVNLDGLNKLNGSFYVNSENTGNWEDYIVKEVVDYVDVNYRTIADAKSRGIAGHSMGGFGAFNIAFKHPDVYSCVYSLSPGTFYENGLVDAMPTWNNRFLNAYGAAFAPDMSLESPYAAIPTFDGSDEDNKIVEKWESGFGDLDTKVDNYLNNEKQLKAIRIQYGAYDRYGWIPNGCMYLSQLLNDRNVEHELIETKDGHSIPREFRTESFIPFFSQNLKSD